MLDLVFWAKNNFVDSYMTQLIELYGWEFEKHPHYQQAMASIEADPACDLSLLFAELKRKCHSRQAA